jgi:hypothetical protein
MKKLQSQLSSTLFSVLVYLLITGYTSSDKMSLLIYRGVGGVLSLEASLVTSLCTGLTFYLS